MSNTQRGKYLYLANAYYDEQIFTKIGTTVNIKARLRPITTNSPLIINSIFYTFKKWPIEDLLEKNKKEVII
ncbi:MAG: hypothetical protein PF693_12085 [Spirochaetia bacterium]|jgi:hypothetical protein|nr:hypothetical protein [Spirochaetia bacterium]